VPGLAEGEVVREPVSLLDVLPTLLEALALERPAGLQGRSLLPLLRGETIDAVPHFAEAAADRRSFGVRTEGWKYLRFGSGRETLFDLERDPGERVDRCRVDPETCRSLRRALAEWRREMGRAAAEGGRPSPRPAELDEATRERLEALGYADPGEPRSGGSRGTP
jgi:arylsulfatase A-like enzyme